MFSVHRLPDVVVTDNGPTFTGELFQEFVKRNGIRHIRTAPFHPASNGLAKRAVQTLKNGLKKMSGANVETNLSFSVQISDYSADYYRPGARRDVGGSETEILPRFAAS